jgi:hypothetical protein
MTTSIETSTISASMEQRVYPPYDALHGTPHAMLWRKVVITMPRGTAAFEQTDYGHPGRLNPWEPRGVSSPLAPQLSELRAVAEAMGALGDRA